MSLSDEITRLNELKECGALTEEEFQAAKANLFAGVTTPPPAADTSSSPGSPASPTVKPGVTVNQWCMFLHFAQFAGYIIPFAGFVAPIVLWQMKKDESPLIDRHGKIVVNWIITAFIAAVVLTISIIGIPLLLVLALLSIIFGVIGGIKAGNGEVWDYPMTIRFIK